MPASCIPLAEARVPFALRGHLLLPASYLSLPLLSLSQVRDSARIQSGRNDGLALVCLFEGISAADISAPVPPLPVGGLRALAATKSLNNARMLLAGLQAVTTLKADFDRIPEPGLRPAVPLSAHLAPAFGLDDPVRLKRILDAAGYVMSNGGWARTVGVCGLKATSSLIFSSVADFAIKLLILNERRRVGASVIL